MNETYQTNTAELNLDSFVEEVRSLLERQRMVEGLVTKQAGPKQEMLEMLTYRQHLAEMQNRLASRHPADIAFVLESLPMEDRLRIWNQVWKIRGGAILLELSDNVRKGILESLPRDELVAVLKQVSIDDLSTLAPSIPRDVLEEVYQSLDSQSQQWVVSSIAYPDDSVGQLVSHHFVTTRMERKLDEVLNELRGKDLPPHLDSLYIVDARHVFLGVLPVERLISADSNMEVQELMKSSPVVLSPYQKATDAAKAFERYNLLSAPVVDERNRLVGRVTVESVMDFLRKQSDEDALKLAGLQGEEDIFASVWASARNRWFWLGLNLVTAFIASRVIGMFENTIIQLAALATLMPIVASIGGNTGNQTVALIIRGLTLDRISRSNIFYLFLKEIRVSSLNGLVWGGLMGILTMILYQNFRLGLVMATAMYLNLLVAALVGVGVPLLLDRLGYDPAQGSSVLLTFSTDSMGFFVFLGLASIFLL
ncbi:magnesium transporter [bacterium]|nr:magnesium transporter [bacterium]